MGTLGKRYKLVLTIHDMIYFTPHPAAMVPMVYSPLVGDCFI